MRVALARAAATTAEKQTKLDAAFHATLKQFSLREFAAREMSNALLSLPAVVGESLWSLDTNRFFAPPLFAS